MTTTLQGFAAHCHEILARDNNPAGRAQVAALLKEALKDQAFVVAQFGEGTGERHILYQDPELGFCILAHDYQGPKDSGPHDHAHSWAIYGQARGETAMSDYALVQPATPDAPGQVRKTRSYALRPGDAHVYNEGDLHSPSRAGPTRLIRIEGTDMATVTRMKFLEIAP